MMGNVISLKEFLNEYGESMAGKVTRELNVIHDPASEREKEISEIIRGMKKRPLWRSG